MFEDSIYPSVNGVTIPDGLMADPDALSYTDQGDDDEYIDEDSPEYIAFEMRMVEAAMRTPLHYGRKALMALFD